MVRSPERALTTDVWIAGHLLAVIRLRKRVKHYPAYSSRGVQDHGASRVDGPLHRRNFTDMGHVPWRIC